MKEREHNNQQPLIVERAIQSLQTNSSKYAGYVPIIHGGNAGPRQDQEAFDASCNAYCHTRGWHWIPQSPQMPYANNLDLVVFP